MTEYRRPLDVLNYIDANLGGTGGFDQNLDALNDILILLGGEGGYDQVLDAVNAWVVLLGGTGGFDQTIDAYNEVSRLLGGASNADTEVGALNTFSDLVVLVEPDWIIAGVDADLDFEWSRFYIDGVYYSSWDEVVAAGKGTYDTGVPVLLYTIPTGAYTIAAEATSDGSLNTIQSIIVARPAAGGESSVMRRNPADGSAGGANLLRINNTVGGTTTNRDGSAIANSTRFSAAAQWADSNYRLSQNGGANSSTTTASRPRAAVEQIYIGGSVGGLALWGGTIHRVSLFVGTVSDADRVDYSQPPNVIADTLGGVLKVSDEWFNYSYVDQVSTDIKICQVGFKTRKRRPGTNFILDTTPTVADDHHIAAQIDFNGRLVVLGAGHSDDYLYCRVGTDLNPATLGAKVDLATPLSMSNLTYTQLHDWEGDLWGITQVADLSWQPFHLAIDGAGNVTPTIKKKFYTASGGSPAQYYHAVFPKLAGSSLVYFACMQHPTNVQNPFKVMSWDMATGEVFSSNGLLGTIDDASPNTALTTWAAMETIRTPAALRSSSVIKQFRTADGKWMLMLRDVVNADGSDAKLIIGVCPAASDPHLAASWAFREVCSMGLGSFASFDPRDTSGQTIYVQREAAAVYTTEVWATADDWVTPVQGSTLLTNSTSEDRRINGIDDDNIPYTYARGSYTNFDSYDLDFRLGNPTP